MLRTCFRIFYALPERLSHRIPFRHLFRQGSFSPKHPSRLASQPQIMVGREPPVSQKRTFARGWTIRTFEESCSLVNLVEHGQIERYGTSPKGSLRLPPEETASQTRNLVERRPPVPEIMPAETRKKYRNVSFSMFPTPSHILCDHFLECRVMLHIEPPHQPREHNIRLHDDFVEPRIWQRIARKLPPMGRNPH